MHASFIARVFFIVAALASVASAASFAFHLVNPGTHSRVQAVNDGDVIDLNALGLSGWNIEAVPTQHTHDVESVVFDLNDQPRFRVENVSPYALCGDTAGYFACDLAAEGQYVVTATGYSRSHGRGRNRGSATVSFSFGTTPPSGPRVLDPLLLPKFVTDLVIPPAMPQATGEHDNKYLQEFRIGARQFRQQVLPAGYPATTVWGYGSVEHPETFNWPAYTIEARHGVKTHVEWTNELVDAHGNFVESLVPIDQTEHWANPLGQRDSPGSSQGPYRGPIPTVPHLHGANADERYDGHPEAWFLPNANNIPDGAWRTGTQYDVHFPDSSTRRAGGADYVYDNDQTDATLWYHDHTVGITRTNVYAGLAGFYLLRGHPDTEVLGLPGPAPQEGDAAGSAGSYREIPLVFQDRSFLEDGSLFYPDNRAFFEGLGKDQLQIPFAGSSDATCTGAPSDIGPVHNPEFFGTTMTVNGRTWPKLDVEAERYRFRLLNGCGSRFLVLRLSNGGNFHIIGAEQGFLPAPHTTNEVLIGPGERYDIIIDFADFAAGDQIELLNVAPDEPYGGGEPGVDFEPANPDTTGKVMRFDVHAASRASDPSTPVAELSLKPVRALPSEPDARRTVSVNELDSASVRILVDADGNPVLDANNKLVQDCSPNSVPFGPAIALLGTVDDAGNAVPRHWGDPVTENIRFGYVEEWEIINLTEDAHTIHQHLVSFETVGRRDMTTGAERGPEPYETGRKDTVISYPGEATRIKARFDRLGEFVWHCHVLEHEDNEMMRPFRVVL